jgi:hypothetical protein
MSKKPVLVVHGIASHDQAEFEQRVSTLQFAVGPHLPEVKLIPVFWGDLGGQSKDIRDCLPSLKDGHWATRAEGILSIGGTGLEVRAEPRLSNEERASIITGSSLNSEAVRSEPGTHESAITEALGSTRYLQKIDDVGVLQAIGDVVNQSLSEDVIEDEHDTFEVRSEPSELETRSWVGGKVKGVITAIDKLVGKLLEDRLGVLNQRLRNSLMNGVADTLGDIVAYHSNKGAIQTRLWDAIDDQARGYGTDTNPIGVIAHSLGGVISFDAIVAPANGKAL